MAEPINVYDNNETEDEQKWQYPHLILSIKNDRIVEAKIKAFETFTITHDKPEETSLAHMVLWLISFYYTFQLSFPSEYMLLYFIQTNVIMDKANKRKKLNTAYQNFAKKYELLVKKQNNEKVHVSPKAKQNLY